MRKFRVAIVVVVAVALSGIGFAAVSAATNRAAGPLCYHGHKVSYATVCPKGWHHVNIVGTAGPAGPAGTNGTNGTNGARGATGPAGPAGVAPTSPILYSSLVSPMPPDWWSLAFDATSTSALGNKINLTSSGAKLNNVVVELDSQATGTGTFSLPITLTIYQPGSPAGTVGTQIATDTQTFAIPYAPAADPVNCAAGTASIFPGYSNDGTQWFDAATGSCYYGITDAVTFDFSSQGVTLPGTVVYEISYDGTTGPAQSLNVLLSTEAPDGAVAVGSDTDPGNVFITSTSNPATTGEMTCSNAQTGFVEYNTAYSTTNGCGASIGTTPVGFVPAVEFNTAS